MAIETPQEVFDAAKAAYEANKADKSLKKAMKTAKKALAAHNAELAAKAEAKAAKKAKKANKKRKAEQELEAEPEKPVKEKKAKKAKKEKVVDAESLKAAEQAAKAAYKANKADKSLKAAWKAAKQACTDFDASAGATEAATPTPTEDAGEDMPVKKSAAAAAKPAGDAPAEANEKLFLGNLSWDIDDDAIREFFKDCGTLTDIYWLEDKETGRFKGCGFVTFENVDQAIAAQKKHGEIILERDIKIDFAKARPGGNKSFGGGAGGGGGSGNKGGRARELSARPDNCTTVFAGNLSYDVDDDSIREFASGCGDIKAIRWLTDKQSGEFKGCGFIEFYDSESVDNFIKKNGHDLLGRSIRLDYSAPRPERSW
mmetsp:Transcript_22071/g.43865  ORF Transcript_22071/g.43865 Transcript_22071/m.43865 type:complete len:371 (+) Transcript_22071:35-1147(+)|eukprot:CAMPEP_0175156436 /NCGR_PEP_ID=MMETSP0087-20121206/21593_1 /TAXON_ID=136419 /ORGANISM="Unknown Unknown, Strain D1" /LENGTH=370 /DNA_ID=CAMNT_0016443829 /DNA_START=35 /DNA_END=1147 /DNA_ORIENTATION=-